MMVQLMEYPKERQKSRSGRISFVLWVRINWDGTADGISEGTIEGATEGAVEGVQCWPNRIQARSIVEKLDLGPELESAIC